ncbi:hypothetical protein [Caminibacter mediatlanticus]|uniref:Uncharacterized protein n=1 Tax=Caminibacter mediatlanticus TB-2 TaxID=391592 RepID=A0AAI9AHM9_9BACT|nr:hypothetical protein [Caminibacter mediatlanticus]EDM23802.1 hypothetical protein CMTB2_01004 [Caminibacter mediatlanticus TB-2]
MLFEIRKEIKEYIKKEKDFLKPSIILNLVKDVIKEMLAYNIPKKTILDKLNKELGTNINYYTFVSFVRKLNKIKTNKFNTTTQTKKQTFLKEQQIKKDETFNPWEMLKNI